MRSEETNGTKLVFSAHLRDQGGIIGMTIPTFGNDAPQFLNIDIRYSFVDIPSDPYRVRCTIGTGDAPRGACGVVSMLPTAETVARITSCLEYCTYVERHVAKHNTHPMLYDEYRSRFLDEFFKF
ncbi:MAG: hypothetical protein G01um101448_513 [Parcubacteria group bacterium Gr01-1014_48]|nr:MAG: hypothetical protein G01um101448_513 [Parcubacteria group bacterium Gr01-1014_48]